MSKRDDLYLSGDAEQATDTVSSAVEPTPEEERDLRSLSELQEAMQNLERPEPSTFFVAQVMDSLPEKASSSFSLHELLQPQQWAIASAALFAFALAFSYQSSDSSYDSLLFVDSDLSLYFQEQSFETYLFGAQS